VGISGKEKKMEWDGQMICAPQFGLGKARFRRDVKGVPRHEKPVKPLQKLDQRPTSALCVAELVEKEWSHRVVSTTKTHAVVEFFSPNGGMREERTILRGMLPVPVSVGRGGRPVLHLGKTARDHETGSWKQHLDNRAAHAEMNRGHATDHGAGTRGGGRHGGKDGSQRFVEKAFRSFGASFFVLCYNGGELFGFSYEQATLFRNPAVGQSPPRQLPRGDQTVDPASG
jgi:hypothetical protein